MLVDLILVLAIIIRLVREQRGRVLLLTLAILKTLLIGFLWWWMSYWLLLVR